MLWQRHSSRRVAESLQDPVPVDSSSAPFKVSPAELRNRRTGKTRSRSLRILRYVTGLGITQVSAKCAQNEMFDHVARGNSLEAWYRQPAFGEHKEHFCPLREERTDSRFRASKLLQGSPSDPTGFFMGWRI